MHFRKYRQPRQTSEVISYTKETKYLGITLDEKLTYMEKWKAYLYHAQVDKARIS